MYKMCPKDVYLAILAYFGTPYPTQKPHYQESTFTGSHSPKSLSKLVLQENGFISIFLKRNCLKNAQNVIFHAFLANFGTMWPTQKSFTLPTKYFKWLIISQKSPKISTTRKLIHFYLFWSESVWKVPKMSYFLQFWPTQKPLTLPKSTFTCSYSTKSLHELVLPENGFISILFEAKMFGKCPKCLISCYFGQFFWDHITHSRAPYTINKVC